ncbi:hypothetical protein D3C78_621620 [compost metagenome]
MIDDLPNLKAANVERCASRAREGYARAKNFLTSGRPARDAATLNILRHSQTKPDTARHLNHRERLSTRQNTRKVSMIVPTLPREHATLPLLRLVAKRPTLGRPRWSIGPSQRPCLNPPCIEKQRYRLMKKRNYSITDRTIKSRATP